MERRVQGPQKETAGHGKRKSLSDRGALEEWAVRARALADRSWTPIIIFSGKNGSHLKNVIGPDCRFKPQQKLCVVPAHEEMGREL